MFITFEGIDGSGKTTHARLLVEHLRSEGLKPLLVREPGGTALSERVRALLLDPEADVTPRAELLLFSAARAQLVEEAIRPALAEGRPVVCDRFYDSTTAYQGGGRQIAPTGWLEAFHRFVTARLEPDRTFLVDVPPEVAARRRDADDRDRIEAAGTAFFERVRAAYLHLAERDPERVRVLDGTRTIEALHGEILRDLTRLRSRPRGDRPTGGTAPPASG
ncbi:MAG: dTMP kinase [Rhodothermales bacterium]|nr:dTMP kinase [Rhodothermales bacterium]